MLYLPRQDKTRQDKTRQDKTRQSNYGLIPSFVKFLFKLISPKNLYCKLILFFIFFLSAFFFSPFISQAQAQEVVNSRTKTSKTFSLGNDQYRYEQVLKTVLHYPTAGPDSSVLDGEVDFTPQRVNNAQLDGWLITQAGWHYSLGKPADKSADGWVGFGGRQGQKWFNFRLTNVGYLEWNSKAFDDVGGTISYDRKNLSTEVNTLTLGPNNEALPVESVFSWNNLWTTPQGGTLGIRWRVNGNELKEEIVINQKARDWIATNKAPKTKKDETWFGFVFDIDWDDIPKVIRDGALKSKNDDLVDDGKNIEFKDEMDRLLAFMPVSDAYVVDDKGEEIEGSRTPLRKRFYKKGANTYLLVGLRTDELAGLPNGDLVFDPTFESQPDAAAGLDTFIINTLANSNYATNVQINIGQNGVSSSIRRQFIKFDISSIPSTAVVSSAQLALTITSDEATQTSTVSFYRQKKLWTEAGATWNKYNSSVAWTTAGGFNAADCEQTPIASLNLTASETGVKTWTLTASTASDLDLGFGWLIKSEAETAYDSYQYASSDYTTNITYRPKLTIEYTTNTDPSSPTSATQLKNDASTAISNGGYTNETNVKLRASATDADTTETLTLFFEAVANSSSFTSSATPTTGGSCATDTAFADCASKVWYATSDSGDYSSTPYTGTVNVVGLSDATGYKWQVKACDDEPTCSSWVAFNATTPNFTIDTTAPSISVTALSPDPTTDTTPTLSGTATDTGTALTAIQFQVDSTSGSWSSCSADDSAIDETSETFTCTTGTLLDGSHTIYIRATDSASNTTALADYGTDTFTVDTTAPASFDLDSPGNDSYISNERPTFKWKAASTPDATSGLSKYKVEVDNGDSGDFTVDDIPTSGTADVASNRYIIHFDGFSDSDSTNNYISVYTKSSSEWGSGNNDGKLKEGKRTWKVIARDNVGNETTSSRTLFVDRTNPNVEISQINDTKFSSNSFNTNDKTPTIFGKITDSLAGDSSSTSEQVKQDNKVSAGPKEVEIKFEKRNYLGVYSLHTLATVNISELYWSADGSKITDNSKNTSNKYSGFSYAPTTDLPLGTYKITLAGKDKADNGGGTASFTLTIKTFEEIAQIPEVKKTIEELEKEGIPKEKIEEVIKEQGIVVPEELKKPSVITDGIGKIFAGTVNLWWKGVDTSKFLVAKIDQTLAFAVKKTGQGLALTGNQIKNSAVATTNTIGKAITFVGEKTGQSLAYRRQKNKEAQTALAKAYSDLAQKAPGVIGDGLLAIARSNDRVNKTVEDTSNKVTDAIGKEASTTSKFIAGRVGTVTGGVKTTAQAIGKTINQQASRLATAWQSSQESISKPASEEVQNLATRLKIASSTFISIAFDKEPTRIFDIRVEEVKPTSIAIVWQTNHYATGKVNYGFSTQYDKEAYYSQRVKEHRIVLKDLEPGKLYYFEVMSQNKNYVYDAYHTFTTPSKESVSIVEDEGNWVLVRMAPSLTGKVLAKVAVGQSFPLLEEKDGWVKIKLDPSTSSGQAEGWVFGELVKIGGGK